ncbi:MAG: hypothetical protein JRG96_11970 [Deltaproteobacteria bacterium]|nr:hypothetical protein [Deltaproteobacteria bacterium]MBW2418198.1 hypothetical protein [Deltaproteobacteria bacterium]
MMRWNSFAGTLVFGAVCAALLPAAWLLLGPVMGRDEAAALYLAAAGTLYAAGLAPSPRRSIWVGCVMGGLSLLLLVVARDLVEVAAGMALLLAGFRCCSLHRSGGTRTLAVEAVLGLGGLALAGLLAGPGPVGIALALWGYFLVQAVFFLVAGLRVRSLRPPDEDPFERARSRLLALLEEPEGS